MFCRWYKVVVDLGAAWDSSYVPHWCCGMRVNGVCYSTEKRDYTQVRSRTRYLSRSERGNKQGTEGEKKGEQEEEDK